MYFFPDEVEFLREEGKGCIFVGCSLILFCYLSILGGDRDYQLVATILVSVRVFVRLSTNLSFRQKVRRVGMLISLFVAIAAYMLFLFATFTPEHFRRFRYFSSSGYSAESESSATDYDEPRDELDE
jgi:hypothetical protein